MSNSLRPCGLYRTLTSFGASHDAVLVGKNKTVRPCRRYETQVQSLGQEDPWKEGMTTNSSILAWITPWTEEPGELQSIGSHRVETTEATAHCARTPFTEPARSVCLSSLTHVYPDSQSFCEPVFLFWFTHTFIQ